MSRQTDREFLLDILEAIRRVRLYVADMSYADFMADLKTQDAVIRALGIVGEATKRLSRKYGSIIRKHPGRIWPACATDLSMITLV